MDLDRWLPRIGSKMRGVAGTRHYTTLHCTTPTAPTPTRMPRVTMVDWRWCGVIVWCGGMSCGRFLRLLCTSYICMSVHYTTTPPICATTRHGRAEHNRTEQRTAECAMQPRRAGLQRARTRRAPRAAGQIGIQVWPWRLRTTRLAPGLALGLERATGILVALRHQSPWCTRQGTFTTTDGKNAPPSTMALHIGKPGPPILHDEIVMPT